MALLKKVAYIAIVAFLWLFVRSCTPAFSGVIETIAYEASGEGYSGMLAVSNIIKTRVNQKQWADNAYDVVMQPYQFSCWHPKTGKPTQKRKLTTKELEIAQKAWENAIVWEYNHYAVKTLKPYWAYKAKREKIIGNHKFYKL